MSIVALFTRFRTSFKRYFAKRSDRYHLRNQFHRSPLKIVIGASGFFEDGWIGTEARQLDLLIRKDWQFHFKNNPVDAMLAEHVWEHLTVEEGIVAARNCFDHLKPGGYLRVAVPDGFHPNKEYIDYVKPGGIGAGADDHKVLYDYRSFSEIFEKAGFRVEVLEYFDLQGGFHYTDWNPETGTIRRSKRFDPRNADGQLNYTSLILDAHK